MLFDNKPDTSFRNENTKILSNKRKEIGTLMTHDMIKWRKVVSLKDPVMILRNWTNKNVINRAFYKMLELSKLISSVPENVLCLCEAPGGFLQASHCIWPDAKCCATSLDTETSIKFDKQISPENILKFRNNSNILDLNVCDEIISHCKDQSFFDLVTSDGGIEHENLDSAEQAGTNLFLAQIYIGIQCLKKNGTLIVKVFEGSTLPTCQIYELTKLLFRNSTIVKPFTSKVANSERYVVFTDFTKTEQFSYVVNIFKNAMEKFAMAESDLYLIDLGIEAKNATDEFDFHINNQITNIGSMQNLINDIDTFEQIHKKKRLTQAIEIASEFPNIFPKPNKRPKR